MLNIPGTWRDFSATPITDIYIHHLNGEVTNLRNTESKNDPLPSTIAITGDSIGKGALDLKGRINILKDFPDMDVTWQLVHASLPAFNSYSRAYFALDFSKGDFSVYSKIAVRDAHLHGFIKPIATGVEVIDFNKTGGPLHLLWETVASAIITVFTNHSKDQFATQIALEGNLKHPDTSTWSTIVGIVHNAFVEAISRSPKDDLGDLEGVKVETPKE